MNAQRFSASCATLLILAACGGADPTRPALGSLSAAVGIVDGNGQTDTVARELPVVVVAQVTDKESAAPMQAVLLNWFAVSPADAITGIAETTFVGASLTDVAGAARYRWTLGKRAGIQTLLAWALDAEGRKDVHAEAKATAVPDLAARITTGGAVTVWVGERITTASRVIVLDGYGNPIWNRPPMFGAAAGWTTSADTAWATTETNGSLPLALDTARASLAVTALQPLRSGATLTYACVTRSQFSARVDSIAMAGVVDSMFSHGQVGNGYDLWLTTTTVRWHTEMGATWADTATASAQRLTVGAQAVGTLTYGTFYPTGSYVNVGAPLASWDGTRYVGGDLRLCSGYGAPDPLPYSPIVLTR